MTVAGRTAALAQQDQLGSRRRDRDQHDDDEQAPFQPRGQSCGQARAQAVYDEVQPQGHETERNEQQRQRIGVASAEGLGDLR